MLELKCAGGCSAGIAVIVIARLVFVASRTPTTFMFCNLAAMVGVVAVIGAVLWYLDQKESVGRTLLARAEQRNRKVR